MTDVVSAPVWTPTIPHKVTKLTNLRKVIARRLTESKQTVPHIYLAIDVRLDALLSRRADMNAAPGSAGLKISVNDMLIKALALALIEVPACNVNLVGDQLFSFDRADVAVAVSIPGGLVTPIIAEAQSKSVSEISETMKALASRAKEGKLAPHEYNGGTASLSNMGMYGVKQFDAVINPPQGMILAVGAGDSRAIGIDGAITLTQIMTVTGGFDHRAIDGADGAKLMAAFKRLVETPSRLDEVG